MAATHQTALTVLAPIPAGNVNALRDYLTSIGQNIDKNAQIDFSKLSLTHFLKWVVLPERPSFPPQLAFESNFDGELLDYLGHIWEIIPGALRIIYGFCGVSTNDWNEEAFVAFMKSHAVPIGAFYIGLRGETVQVTRRDELLRKGLQGILDNIVREGGLKNPQDVFRELKAGASLNFLAPPSKPLFYISLPALGSLAIAFLIILLLCFLAGTAAVTVGAFHRGGAPAAVGSAAIILVCLVVIIAPLGWYLIKLYKAFRALELQDESNWRVKGSSLSTVPEHEDWEIQNPMTHIVDIKPGFLRLRVLKIVLWGIHQLAGITFNQGSLGGIPTIHFARWVIIDDDKRLLFFSNYDGSWESYLGDFIMRASAGLTAVWSNTADFPPTKNLVLEGATHADAFKQWTRQHQIPTQIWYSAYPNSSISNRQASRAIRNGLAQRNPSEAAIREWLELFQPPPSIR